MIQSNRLYNFLDKLCFWKNEFNMNYLGFNIFYNLGNSLISRIRFDKTYEPEVSNIIYNNIHMKNPTILDIGSNIGLISLNILSKYPEATIFAFEPGPIQYQMFKKTIQSNNLANIFLDDIALSNKNGTAIFNIHSDINCAGDGLKDTGRAGDTTTITVKTKTLDTWWKENNKLKIDLIKIDTEGAELMVFNGANDFFTNCKPIIIFEMHKTNLKPFDYSEIDILTFLNNFNYSVESFSGTIISSSNIVEQMEQYEEFIAKPKRGLASP